jgi:nuclear protein localization protein 4 homolog
LKKAGIENGAQIFVPGDAKFQDIIHKPNKIDEEEEKIETSKNKEQSPTGVVEPPGTKKWLPDGRTTECSHGIHAKCLHCLGINKDNFQDVEYKCHHPKDQMCANCKDNSGIQDAKHIPFDHHLREMRNRCKKKHKPDQRCQDCIPLVDVSYLMRRDCTSHKPYPLGMCNKCIPPSVILDRQIYRHVDYVSIRNYPEFQKFVDHWQNLHCMEQRVAWLYGYYSEDPNYPEGVRVNVEALYEPPQIGEMNGFQLMNDEFELDVDMVAHSLQLEKVGWVYTSLNYESFLTPKEIREIAAMQEKYSIEHPEGVRVSKFVTVVVKPKGDMGESGIDCYMVSDLGQALERDNVFGNHEDHKHMVVREPEENEMVPNIVKQGKTVKEFDPEFFIVSIAHGQPKELQDYNILKNYDFLPMGRHMKPNKNDLKGYINAHKGEDSRVKFACFQFLLYMIQQLDVETVCTIAQKIADGEPLEDYLVELVESLAQ